MSERWLQIYSENKSTSTLFNLEHIIKMYIEGLTITILSRDGAKYTTSYDSKESAQKAYEGLAKIVGCSTKSIIEPNQDNE